MIALWVRTQKGMAKVCVSEDIDAIERRAVDIGKEYGFRCAAARMSRAILKTRIEDGHVVVSRCMGDVWMQTSRHRIAKKKKEKRQWLKRKVKVEVGAQPQAPIE